MVDIPLSKKRLRIDVKASRFFVYMTINVTPSHLLSPLFRGPIIPKNLSSEAFPLFLLPNTLI